MPLAVEGPFMGLSDRQNWLLSGAVGLLLVVNGLVRLPGRSGAVELALVGVLVTGGALAVWNAASGLRDPATVDDIDWTRRKTLINVATAIVLVLMLAVAVAGLAS